MMGGKQMYETTQAIVDLAGSVSQDPEKADWYDVDEFIELLPNPIATLKDLLRYAHKEWL